MPFALVAIGLLMIITGINNTYAQFGAQLQTDFTGQKSFLVWIVAFIMVGALGYIKDLRTFSHYFMALILISMFLSNKGVFAQLQAAIAQGPTAPQAVTGTTPAQTAISPSASTTTINNAITSNQTGPTGSVPQTAGQAKAFGWLNYIFGFSTNSAGAAQ